MTAPAGDGPRTDTSALREALAQALHQARCGPKCSVGPSDQNARDADALLAGPLAALLDRLTHAEDQVGRVRSMRAVATDGKVTVAALDWALDG